MIRAAAPLLLSLLLGAAACTPARPPSAVVHSVERADHAAACRRAQLAVQILGSGGPIAESDGRASTGYAIWVSGRVRALVDLGPGTMHAYGASGADPADLDVVLLSHLHVDHSSDLAALLKSASFGSRERELRLFGPTGDGAFPATTEFVRHLLSPGGYMYLDGYLGEGQPFVLRPRDVSIDSAPLDVFESERLSVRAVGVPHGPVPALGFVIRAGDATLAFTGDQRLDAQSFVDLVEDADLLVAHMAIPEGAEGPAAELHAPPSRIGEVAAEARVGRLVLSHLMRRALDDLDGSLAQIRGRYAGPVQVADDGVCVVVRPR